MRIYFFIISKVRKLEFSRIEILNLNENNLQRQGSTNLPLHQKIKCKKIRKIVLYFSVYLELYIHDDSAFWRIEKIWSLFRFFFFNEAILLSKIACLLKIFSSLTRYSPLTISDNQCQDVWVHSKDLAASLEGWWTIKAIAQRSIHIYITVFFIYPFAFIQEKIWDLTSEGWPLSGGKINHPKK